MIHVQFLRLRSRLLRAHYAKSQHRFEPPSDGQKIDVCCFRYILNERTYSMCIASRSG